MEDRRCPACGRPNPTEANFCSACGENLDALPVDLDDQRATEELETQSRFAGLTVPLVAIAVLGLIATLVFLSNGTDPTDETTRDEVPTPTPGPMPTPTAEPSPEPTRSPRPTPTPIPTVRIDPTTIPALDATHLSIAYRDDVFFLDLTTGEWTGVETGIVLSGGWGWFGPFDGDGPLSQFGPGILVADQDRGAVQATISGETRRFGETDQVPHVLLGVRNELAFFQVFPDDEANTHVVMVYDPNGALVDTVELPADTWPEAITSDGRIVIQAGGRVFALAGDQTTELAAGEARGAFGDLILVYTCDASLDCSIDAVNTSTLERFPTGLPAGAVDVFPDGTIVLWGPGEPQRWELVDNEFIEAGPFDEQDFDPYGQSSVAIDASGIRAVVDSGEVVLTAPANGDVELSRIAWPAPTRCCPGELAIVFLTLD